MTARAPAVDLVYFDAGGGHRASALALQAEMARQHPAWQVRLVNLREVLDPGDRFRRLTGMPPEDIYNRRLARGWTLGLKHELKLLQAMIRWAHPALTASLARHWQASAPDLVVSLIPNFNRALGHSLANARPGVPFVVLLTDLADHPPHFWIERGLDQHVVCGSARAVRQALDAGLPPTRVHATTGMIIRPDFYAPPPVDRARQRVQLGLDPDRPTGLVLFGGQGSRAMLSIARRLPDTPLILACGHNHALAETLRREPARAPRVVLGFTREMARTMHLADFLIGKPGPGCVSEAMQCHLPVIVIRNAWTLPQERYNADWVLEQGVGRVVIRWPQIGQAVEELLAHLPRYREATWRLRNRAVFEVPAILADILETEKKGFGAQTTVVREPRPSEPLSVGLPQ